MQHMNLERGGHLDANFSRKKKYMGKLLAIRSYFPGVCDYSVREADSSLQHQLSGHML